MITQELLDLIKNAAAQGISEPDIKIQLQQAGWQETDIEEGLRSLANATSTTPTTPDTTGRWPSQMSWKKVLMYLIPIVLILLLALAIFMWLSRSQNKPTQQPQGQNQAVQSYSTNQNNNPAGTAPPNTSPGPDEAYLAYKKFLFQQAKTGTDLFTMAQKYLPSNVIQQWNASGGVSAVFLNAKTSCPVLVTYRHAGPGPIGMRIDKIDYNLDKTSATLTAASGPDKGTIYMDKEADGWKMQQETWTPWESRLSGQELMQATITETQQCMAEANSLR